MLKHMYCIYFSPTGGTRKAALNLAQTMACAVEEIDLSQPDTPDFSFEQGDRVLFAAPVFGGRIPTLMAQKLARCAGRGTLAVTAVVYGNRAFDDALLELNDCVGGRGFLPVASAALLAEHSMVRAVAAGRPDERDAQEMQNFGQQILAKLSSGQGCKAAQVPGNRPYREWQPGYTPLGNPDRCVGCGLCSKLCPAKAIAAGDPTKTALGLCMICMRCVHICPQGARTLPELAQHSISQRLAPLTEVRCENQLFL